MRNALQVMSHPLSDRGLRLEFLRLRCGTEGRLAHGLARASRHMKDRIHAFVAFSEWDAVLFAVCSELYPQALTDLYADADIASSISGTSGYFAYLWDHPVNRNWQEHLGNFEKSGPSLIISLRFADWFRRDVGLGTEVLLCNALQRIVTEYPDLQILIAHSLGWHDAVVVMHMNRGEARLITLLARIRLLTLQDCIDAAPSMAVRFSRAPSTNVIADSHAHVIGGFDSFTAHALSLGNLTSAIETARILVRVPPSYEPRVRNFLQERVEERGSISAEIGHYNLSIDVSPSARRGGAEQALSVLNSVRQHIGSLGGGAGDSYSETTTTLRFSEPARVSLGTIDPLLSAELAVEIATVQHILTELPRVLDQLGVSSLTKHRFVALLVTLLGHLSDPVRNTVVRYISRFARSIPDIVRELEPSDIDDLCHSFEYALGQAVDGVTQSEYAGALGMRGQSGYSRFTVAVEWYLRSTFARLGVALRLPLITFGLRGGNTVSTGRFQIDIPFGVLFVPSRWHILLHEVGHLAWLHTFGWMTESLAIYRAMERDIRIDLKREAGKKHSRYFSRQAAERVHLQFLRTRDVVRELFPSYVMFALPCAGNIEEFDALTLRHAFAMGYSYSVHRELLTLVVMHCLLESMHEALSDDVTDSSASTDASRAAAWWSIWDDLRSVQDDERIRRAVDSIDGTLNRLAVETRMERSGEYQLPSRMDQRLGAKMQILHSRSFHAAASEMLHSVIEVLALRGRLFRDVDPENIGPPLFGRLLDRLGRAQEEQSDPEYLRWAGTPFAGWLTSGEVLTRHRASYVWSRLLMASRDQLITASAPGAFMRSQLSVLLSMWHDATTEGVQSYEDLDQTLRALNVVRVKDSAIA